MYFSRLKKRRGGQIRAVDFVVSLFLFLLMLSQLILLVINIQIRISSSAIDTVAFEELDIFGRQLLLEEGDQDWGYYQALPSTFGLADSNENTYLTLDGAKIARIITGTPNPVGVVSGYEMYDYSTLKETIGLQSDFDFQIGLYPLLYPDISVSSNNFAEVSVKNIYDIPTSDVRVHFFTIDLTNGEVISEGETLTNSDGDTSLQLSDPTASIQGGEHFVFIIVEKGPLWGMNWGFNDPTSDEVVFGASSTTTIWGGAIHSTSLLVTDILAVTPDSHFLSIIYQNSTSGYSNKTINLATALDGNETISIPNEGLVAFISVARNDNQYQVGIGSYPAILDRDSSDGSFYQVFGELEIGSKTKSLLSKIYPVNVRSTLMSFQLTLWRN
ncbi:MAG: hypothetical protein ACFFC6_14180 [Promethearchaeota archaeon]